MYFENLSINAQQRAIEEERNVIELEDFDADDFVEYFTCILETLGFDDINIRYTGFWNQGDGASFTGQYNKPNYDVLKEIRNVSGDDEVSYQAQEIEELQKEYTKGFVINVIDNNQWGNYVGHENTITAYRCSDDFDEKDERFTKICRELSTWFYKLLKDEYQYNSSDEGIIDSFINEEVEFDDEGERT